MSIIRTYVDASVIIVGFLANGLDHRTQVVYNFFQEPDRLIMVSDYLWLEVMPNSLYYKHDDRVVYINKIFERSEKISSSQAIIDKAISLAASYGLSAMDALHSASAIEGKADELVTFEKSINLFFVFHHQKFVLFPWFKVLLSLRKYRLTWERRSREEKYISDTFER
jgi:predicted nucleic acid-binding protein